jgi:nucleoside-diphosphate-sugar epimerase
MSDILVTGGYGFIGHNVTKKLKDLKHNVIVLDNKTDYGIIPNDELEYLHHERKKRTGYVQDYNYDITNNFAINKAFNLVQPDIVIHLASFPRQKVVNKNPVAGSQVMCEGLINLLEASKKYKVKKFVYVSSSMVYGSFNNDVRENVIVSPEGQYGILKYTGELLVKDYSRRGYFDHTILRPSAVYGPYDVEDRVVSKFFLNAMRNEVLRVNGETEELDFTYVNDAVDGIVGAALSSNTINRTYNITRGRSRSILNAANLIHTIVGSGHVYVDSKDSEYPSRGSLNIDAARKDFDYDPKIDIEDGFTKYYDYLKNSPFWVSKTVS